jgi:hypothetical protein
MICLDRFASLLTSLLLLVAVFFHAVLLLFGRFVSFGVSFVGRRHPGCRFGEYRWRRWRRCGRKLAALQFLQHATELRLVDDIGTTHVTPNGEIRQGQGDAMAVRRRLGLRVVPVLHAVAVDVATAAEGAAGQAEPIFRAGTRAVGVHGSFQTRGSGGRCCSGPGVLVLTRCLSRVGRQLVRRQGDNGTRNVGTGGNRHNRSARIGRELLVENIIVAQRHVGCADRVHGLLRDGRRKAVDDGQLLQDVQALGQGGIVGRGCLVGWRRLDRVIGIIRHGSVLWPRPSEGRTVVVVAGRG